MPNEDLPSINDILEESNLPSYKDFIEVNEEELLSVEDYIEEKVVETLEEEEDIEFTRYSGREYKFVKMNMAYDNWKEWVPKNPTEHMLKNAIDSNEHIGTNGVCDDF